MRARKRRTQRAITAGIVTAILLVAGLIALAIVLGKSTPNELPMTSATLEHTTENPASVSSRQAFIVAEEKLRDKILTPDIETVIQQELALHSAISGRVVFFSVSDGKQPALVVHGIGETVASAWANAAQLAIGEVYTRCIEAKYVRVDIVNTAKIIPSSSFSEELQAEADWYWGHYRRGIAFDLNFDVALLEAELNANSIIDYDNSKQLDLAALNKYLPAVNEQSFTALPKDFIIFTTRGYLYDGEIYELGYENYGTQSQGELGVRLIEGGASAEQCLKAASTAFERLFSNMGVDGKLNYGVYPILDVNIENYSIARHAEAISAAAGFMLAEDSAGLNSESLVNAVKYMDSCTVNQSSAVTYLCDKGSDTIDVFASCMGVEAYLSAYKITGDDYYKTSAVFLGNGISAAVKSASGDELCCQKMYYGNAEHEDFSAVEAERDRATDGAVVLALCRLYAATEDEVWLTAAKLAADKLIAAEHWQYCDMWFSRAMNALTLYAEEAKYFEAGIRNAFDNWSTIESRRTAQPQFFAILLDAYELRARAADSAIELKLDNSPEDADFFSLVEQRKARVLSCYAYPETVMYLKQPESVLGAYLVRNDRFRVRIDDVSQFITVMLDYCEAYTSIKADEQAARAKLQAEAATTEAASTEAN